MLLPFYPDYIHINPHCFKMLMNIMNIPQTHHKIIASVTMFPCENHHSSTGKSELPMGSARPRRRFWARLRLRKLWRRCVAGLLQTGLPLLDPWARTALGLDHHPISCRCLVGMGMGLLGWWLVVMDHSLIPYSAPIRFFSNALRLGKDFECWVIPSHGRWNQIENPKTNLETSLFFS